MNLPASTAALFPKSKAQINREKYAANAAQEAADKKAFKALRAMQRRDMESRRPRFGSQLWAETRGDDRGLSPDF